MHPGGPKGHPPLSPTAWAVEGALLITASLEMQNAGSLSAEVWHLLDARVVPEGEREHLLWRFKNDAHSWGWGCGRQGVGWVIGQASEMSYADWRSEELINGNQDRHLPHFRSTSATTFQWEVLEDQPHSNPSNPTGECSELPPLSCLLPRNRKR